MVSLDTLLDFVQKNAKTWTRWSDEKNTPFIFSKQKTQEWLRNFFFKHQPTHQVNCDVHKTFQFN